MRVRKQRGITCLQHSCRVAGQHQGGRVGLYWVQLGSCRQCYTLQAEGISCCLWTLRTRKAVCTSPWAIVVLH